MTPTPIGNPIPSLTKVVTSLTGFVSEVVSSVHKEAALVLGLLTATGTMPIPATGEKLGASLLIGYAAVCHVAENLFKKA